MQPNFEERLIWLWKLGSLITTAYIADFHVLAAEIRDLLAQYLLDKGIKTDYVCGTYWGKPDGNGQSHAWLMVDKHIIIDITGDQFSGKSTFLNYDKSVYVGEGDDFHRLFEVEDRDVHEHRGLSALGGFCGPRLWDLYRKILKFI